MSDRRRLQTGVMKRTTDAAFETVIEPYLCHHFLKNAQ